MTPYFDSSNPKAMLELSSRHKYIAQVAPMILVNLLKGYPLATKDKVKRAIDISNALYEAILEVREPEDDSPFSDPLTEEEIAELNRKCGLDPFGHL